MPAKKEDTKSKSKSSTKDNKRKRKDEDDDDDDNENEDDNDEEEDETPAKKKKVSSVSKKAAPLKKGKKVVEEEEDDDDDNDDDDDDDDDNDDDDNDDDDNDDDDNDDEENDDDEENGDDDEEEEDEDEPPKKGSKKEAPKKKAAKKETTKSKAKAKKVEKKKVTKKVEKKKESTSSGTGKVPKAKVFKKSERLEEARKAYKWWEAPKLAKGINWHQMEHAGIIFAAPYVRHNIPLKYDGQPIKLTLEQEELASFYAAMPEDGPQLGNPKTAKVFQANFFEDFQATFEPGHPVKDFSKCDFSEIRAHLELKKTLKKAETDDEKSIRKVEKEIQICKYGYALIDGRMEKMGNYNMEPPGLFRGRGEHPKTGKVKERCFAESVNINCSDDAPVPIANLPGHAWSRVQHDNTVTWLCGWNENVQQQNKYVMLAASSSFKQTSDQEKYDKAIRLKSCIGKIRKDYTQKIRSNDKHERQMGVAMWVIDVLALRVGGEKGEDEADTVGCCSLRKEHLTFNPNPESFEIELEFLGKDSMLYKQNINFGQYGDLGKDVYKNLKSFCSGKGKDDDVFETLEPPQLNEHFKSLMPGLTAKVFRTFNASVTLEKELPTAEELEGLTVQEKVTRYNAANRQVAILCNHQKTVSKSTEQMFENLNEKLNTLKEQRQALIEWKALAKKGKADKIPRKKDDKEFTEKLSSNLLAATAKKDKAKTNDEKIAASLAFDAAKLAIKEDSKRRFDEKHMFSKTPDEDSIEKRITSWAEQIRKLEVDIRNKDENKEVALGTSKINYMDPRISVAWCKRCEVPIDKIFAATLRDKFNWAMAVPPSWKFE